MAFVKTCVSVCLEVDKGIIMTASGTRIPVLIQFTQAQVLLGSAAAFLLGGYAFASGWLNWTGLFRAHPLLSLPCTFSLFAAPALFYISIRRMTEVGMRAVLLLSALLSAAGIGLIALGLRLWLRNFAD